MTTKEEVAADLWNRDLAPTPPERRTWRWYHYAALWLGMVMCVPAYTLASSLVGAGMPAGNTAFHTLCWRVARSAPLGAVSRRYCVRWWPAAGTASRAGSAE